VAISQEHLYKIHTADCQVTGDLKTKIILNFLSADHQYTTDKFFCQTLAQSIEISWT
jgi:hypothetical protein